MAISSSPQTIKNTAYGNRVADLEADTPNGPIIGWTQNNQENQHVSGGSFYIRISRH